VKRILTAVGITLAGTVVLVAVAVYHTVGIVLAISGEQVVLGWFMVGILYFALFCIIVWAVHGSISEE